MPTNFLSANGYFLTTQQILMGSHPELPSDFDLIVVGTGLEESILAAAAARIGQSVLHIDPNDYYGDAWSAFNFKSMQEWIDNRSKKFPDDAAGVSGENSEQNNCEKLKNLAVGPDILKNDGETLHELNDGNRVGDVSQKWFLPEEEEEDPDGRPTRRSISEMRQFNLDLSPRLLFSAGAMVDLLIQSNISRYAEFKAVSRVLTLMNGRLEHVPSSRADVFSTKHISVVEKRILMKFIQSCVRREGEETCPEAFEDKSFMEFLKHEKLTDNLIHFVLHSIAMVDKDAGCREGLEATKRFLQSLGRFGNTPFLFSTFGSGELPQAFCRLCAVFGGTYCLGRPIEGIVTGNDGQVKSLVSGGQRINCKKLVIGSLACPDSLKRVVSDGHKIHRQICLTSDSIMPSDKEQLTFLSVAPSADSCPFYTYVQEVGHGAAVCPKSMYLVHLTTKDGPCRQEDVIGDISSLMWSVEFTIDLSAAEALPDHANLFLCSGPQFELDYDTTISQAGEIFKRMFPDQPFLPRAPDPEEIIIGEPQETCPDATGVAEDTCPDEASLETSNDAGEETTTDMSAEVPAECKETT